MKKIAFLALILLFFFVSCSQMIAAKNETDLIISGDLFLARAATDDIDNSVYSIYVWLEFFDEANHEHHDFQRFEQTAEGTFAELKEKSFRFEKIEIEQSLRISCDVRKDGEFVFYGMSDEIVVKAGINKIVIKMVDVPPAHDPDSVIPTEIPVESVSLAKSEVKVIGRYKKEYLVATVSPQNASNKTVTWTTSNKDVATVDENGVVTTLSEGEVTITATADGKSATCEVKVVETFTQEEFRELVPNYKESTEDFEIPEGYTKIVVAETESVFAGWKKLSEDSTADSVMITIPSSVAYIDAYAFYGCNNLYFNFQDKVGWMYFKSDGSGSEYIRSEEIYHRASLENMKNGTGYMQKVSVIDVEFPGDDEPYYTISPAEYEYDMATGESKIKTHEKGKEIEFKVSIMPNHHDGVAEGGIPEPQLVDYTAHTIIWFVDGVLQSGETYATFTWNTESAFIGRHEILCVIDGKYSVVSKPGHSHQIYFSTSSKSFSLNLHKV